MPRSAIALYNAKKVKTSVTPMVPQPEREWQQLKRLYDSIRNAVSDKFPEVNRIDALYLFDSEESDRLDCDGMCSRFFDHTTAIGICKEIVNFPEYAKMVIMHELAHLKHMDHSASFHNYLDSIIKAYNIATGSQIVNDYYGLDDDMRTDGKRKRH